MAQEGEDVPGVYLHEIKRQYVQGESTLTILDGAKLALWAGQSVALVAPSGSGKSTLLHIAGLLESPDEGEVYVGGTATSGKVCALLLEIAREQKVAALIATHNPTLAERLHRRVTIKDGKVVAA